MDLFRPLCSVEAIVRFWMIVRQHVKLMHVYRPAAPAGAKHALALGTVGNVAQPDADGTSHFIGVDSHKVPTTHTVLVGSQALAAPGKVSQDRRSISREGLLPFTLYVLAQMRISVLLMKLVGLMFSKCCCMARLRVSSS